MIVQPRPSKIELWPILDRPADQPLACSYCAAQGVAGTYYYVGPYYVCCGDCVDFAVVMEAVEEIHLRQ